LERLGLFNVRTSSNASRAAFANVRRTLRLIVNEVDEHNPADISYVYSGYAPLSVRLVQCAVQKISAGHAGGSVPGIGLLVNAVGGGSSGTIGSNQTASQNGGQDKTDKTTVSGWKGYEEILKLLPGASVDEVQTVEAKNEREAKATAARAKRKYDQ
jgi:vacuolar protein sorting-associated protein 33A